MSERDVLADVRKALENRRDDLLFCNKDDDCHDGARWYTLALTDLNNAVSHCPYGFMPNEYNAGPECPYCDGRMCARFDGLGCTHDRRERHGYDAAADAAEESR